jgi:hypothetical protein
MNEDIARSSLEHQIKEARTRAELFSKSLQDAREQEAIALKVLEQERERWAHSFEEKSIMIEQLERELTSTVEALDVERTADHKLPLSSEIKVISNEDIDRTFHSIMADVNSQLPSLNRSFERTSVTNTNRHSTDFDARTSYFNGNTASNRPPTLSVSPERFDNTHATGPYSRYTNVSGHSSPTNRPPVSSNKYSHTQHLHMHQPSHNTTPSAPVSENHNIPAHSYHPSSFHSRNQSPGSFPSIAHTATAAELNPGPTDRAPTHTYSHAPAPAPSSATAAAHGHGDEISMWRDLLSQYQEQLRNCKSDLVATLEERDRFARQGSRLEQQVAKLTEERNLLATSRDNAEGKLKFRVSQVRAALHTKRVIL